MSHLPPVLMTPNPESSSVSGAVRTQGAFQYSLWLQTQKQNMGFFCCCCCYWLCFLPQAAGVSKCCSHYLVKSSALHPGRRKLQDKTHRDRRNTVLSRAETSFSIVSNTGQTPCSVNTTNSQDSPLKADLSCWGKRNLQLACSGEQQPGEAGCRS